MASLEFYGKDEYGNSISINLPDFTGCLLLATTPTPPAGTLVADGSEVSREAYDKLFAIFGTQYGAGDGVSTFALPDWRDEFPRFSGASRAVLTTQGDASRDIAGAIQNCITQLNPPPTGAFTSIKTGAIFASLAGGSAWGAETFNFSASNVVPTADENRPRNVAFLPCIIYV